MDTQTLQPESNGPFSSGTGSSGGRSPLLLILVIVLGLGTLGFGFLTIQFYGQANHAKSSASAQAAAAASLASQTQKKSDDVTATQANESPYRGYIAPVQFGSFRISFPKNWSSSVDEEPNGTQVSLTLNPDFIRRTKSIDLPDATRVQLLERTKDLYMSQFTSLIKTKKMTQGAITVSNQPSIDLGGQFPDHKTVREVIVPVRDKVIIFSNEDAKYGAEFSAILSQATIIP
jgi:hypothetical protein